MIKLPKYLKRKWIVCWKERRREPTKKKENLSRNSIFNFFVTKDSFKKDVVEQKEFLEDLGLLIVKVVYLFNLLRMFD
jgi:hypothetical protein